MQVIEREAQQLDATRVAIKMESKKVACIKEVRVEIKCWLIESSEKLKELTGKRDEAKSRLEHNKQVLKYLPVQEQWQSDEDDLNSVIAEKMDEIEKLHQEVSKFKMELMQAQHSVGLTSISKQMEELGEVRDKTTISEDAELRAVIERQKAEIMQLHSNVADLEGELSNAKEKHKQHEKQLRQTTQDLIEKSERVRDLKETQADLERQRRQVDTMLKADIARNKVTVACYNYTKHAIYMWYTLYMVLHGIMFMHKNSDL